MIIFYSLELTYKVHPVPKGKGFHEGMETSRWGPLAIAEAADHDNQVCFQDPRWQRGEQGGLGRGSSREVIDKYEEEKDIVAEKRNI